MIFENTRPPINRTIAEHAIYQRRQYESKVNNLEGKLKLRISFRLLKLLRSEFLEKEFAGWQNKGQDIQKNRYIKDKLSQLRSQANKQLNERRSKLNQLLSYEHEQHKEEIYALQETPQQIQQKMQERVNELKAQKEEQRQIFVNAMLDKRFKLNADELRKVENEFQELKTKHYRNIQMLERQDGMKQQFNEEMIYAELYKREILRKEKQEEEEKRKRQEQINERNNQQLENQRQDQKQFEKMEKQMLQKEWKIDEDRYKKQQEEQFQMNRALNKQLWQTNMEQKQYKQLEEQQERTEDQQMIQNILDKEEYLNQLENAMKLRQREDAKSLLKNYQNRTEEQRTREQEIIRLAEIENQKQIQKQDEKWAQEDAARIKLLMDVYKQREEDVMKKKELEKIIAQQKEIEKDKLTLQLKEYELQQQRDALALYNKNKAHQSNILSQQEEKKKKLEEEILKKQRDDLETKQQAVAYEEKISFEREQAAKRLAQLKSQRPF